MASEHLTRRAAAAGVDDPRPQRHRMFVLTPPEGCSVRAVLRPIGLNDCGEARGVNNDAPAVVVGWTKTGMATERGFRYEVGDAPASISQLPLFSEDPGHLALVVPTTTNGPERLEPRWRGGRGRPGSPPCRVGACDFVTKVCASTPCGASPAEAQSLAGGESLIDEGPASLLLAAGFASIEEFLEWTESASEPQIEAIAAMIEQFAEIAAAQKGGDQ